MKNLFLEWVMEIWSYVRIPMTILFDEIIMKQSENHIPIRMVNGKFEIVNISLYDW